MAANQGIRKDVRVFRIALFTAILGTAIFATAILGTAILARDHAAAQNNPDNNALYVLQYRAYVYAVRVQASEAELRIRSRITLLNVYIIVNLVFLSSARGKQTGE